MVNMICPTHKIEKKAYERGKRFRCSKCFSETVASGRRNKSQKLKLSRGGKCERCGYSKCLAALEWHHKDDNKEFTISKRLDWSYERLLAETSKCDLLCANCHREEHSGIA